MYYYTLLYKRKKKIKESFFFYLKKKQKKKSRRNIRVSIIRAFGYWLAHFSPRVAQQQQQQKKRTENTHRYKVATCVCVCSLFVVARLVSSSWTVSLSPRTLDFIIHMIIGCAIYNLLRLYIATNRARNGACQFIATSGLSFLYEILFWKQNLSRIQIYIRETNNRQKNESITKPKKKQKI